jgi:hypothetical protein
LIALATEFMLEERLRNKEALPLPGHRDITELLDYYLPRRSRDEQEVHEQIRVRHKARARDLERRRRQRIGIPPEDDLTK